jgi:hypothetical protein
MKLLTEDAVRRYHQDGFHFPYARPVAEARRRAAEPMSSAPAAPPPAPAEALAGAVSYRVKPYLLFPWAADLVRNPAIPGRGGRPDRPDILGFHTTMWLGNSQGRSNRVPWHQDGTYFDSRRLSMSRLGGAQSQQRGDRMRQDRPTAPTPRQIPHADVKDPTLMLSRPDGGGWMWTVQGVPNRAVAGSLPAHTMAIHASTPTPATMTASYRHQLHSHQVRHVGPTRFVGDAGAGDGTSTDISTWTQKPIADLHPAAVAAHRDSDARFWRPASRSRRWREFT